MDVDRAVRSAFELDVFPFSILKSIEISLLKTRKIVSSRMLIYSVLWIILYEAVRESEKSINNSIAITSTYLYPAKSIFSIHSFVAILRVKNIEHSSMMYPENKNKNYANYV